MPEMIPQKKTMSAEQKVAYNWAKQQNYSSVAARYAKILADYITECRAAPENKPLTNREALFGTSEKIADVLLPLLPMEGFCPYCNHWVNGTCAVNPHWDCKNAVVNWLNQPYTRKTEQENDHA